ncbi:cytochrome P450 [Saccharopolyspora gloriosae]|uniref:Cytochrome P450 n=1 Tax=Saccharopolyspora gloriosae TaxID=455344 RepID=A0A840NDA0_9PSEU|nr:cytochrome P450 [Saccharopolyspora gloriosae]
MSSPDPITEAWPQSDQEARRIRTDAIELFGTRFHQDPAELYRAIRAQYGPVAPIVLEGGVPAWFVGDYREINQVCGNPDLFARDSRRWNAWDQVPQDWSLNPFVRYQPSMAFAEGDQYRRRIGIFGDALGVIDQFELQRYCETTADRLIDGFATTGAADLISQFAYQLPLFALAWVCGVPRDDAPILLEDMVASVGDGDSAAAHQRIVNRIRRLIRRKRELPGPDLTSRWLEGDPELTEEALAQDLVTTLTAGQQTVAHWIGNALRLMLTDERFAVTLTGGRRSVGHALNEVLWEDTPTQNYVGRFATRDTELGDRQIRAGDMLVLGLAAGNTDPRIRPESYADSVGNNAFLSFGTGDRGCPYPAPQLAETMARAAIEVLLDRLPDVGLSVPPNELEWVPSVWMRGLLALPVEFSPSYIIGD